jgi:hypothetical protein
MDDLDADIGRYRNALQRAQEAHDRAASAGVTTPPDMRARLLEQYAGSLSDLESAAEALRGRLAFIVQGVNASRMTALAAAKNARSYRPPRAAIGSRDRY